jgi:general secretion pathway protein G
MHCKPCGIPYPGDARFCAACGQPLTVGAAIAPATSRKQTWLVLCIVLGGAALLGFGIVAAIALPNLLNAIDRGKQKRTVADIQTVAAAIEHFGEDHRQYPVVEDMAGLRDHLVPHYIRSLPTEDGWGHALHVSSNGESYELISPGKGGVFDGCEAGSAGDFTSDICWVDGEFIQSPTDGRRSPRPIPGSSVRG